MREDQLIWKFVCAVVNLISIRLTGTHIKIRNDIMKYLILEMENIMDTFRHFYLFFDRS